MAALESVHFMYLSIYIIQSQRNSYLMLECLICISWCASIAQLHLLLTEFSKKLDTCHVLPLIFDCRYTRLVSNIYQRDATWGRTECRCCHQRRSTTWIQTGSGRRASRPVPALYLCSSTQKAVIIR